METTTESTEPTPAALAEFVRRLRPDDVRTWSAEQWAAWDDAVARLDAARRGPNGHARNGTYPVRASPGEQALRISYQELFDFAPDGYVLTDGQGVIEQANYAAAQLLSARREFLIGKPLAFLLSEAHQRAFYALLRDVDRRHWSVHDWQVRLASRASKSPAIALSATRVPASAHGTGAVRWVLRDISPQVAAEHALRAEKMFADAVIDTARAYVLVLDEHARIVRANQFLRSAVGAGEHDLSGRHWPALLTDAHRRAALEALRAAVQFGAGPALIADLATPAGTPRVVTWLAKALPRSDAVPVAVLVVGHDITDLQDAQRHALQAERLAAIGQVTAALAHEGRNLLQRIQSGLERLGWRLAGRPEESALLARVQEAQTGLRMLFDDVRAYAAPLKLDVQACHLADVWRDAWAQVRATFADRDADLREDAGAADLWCSVDRFRLGQVFRNLFENAFAACPAPVRVDVVCRDANLGQRDALRVAVRDNGPGFTAEQRGRAFEPFYTTKPQGSGLGMSIAQRIMEAHGGRIDLGTGGGPGAEVLLLLPRS